MIMKTFFPLIIWFISSTGLNAQTFMQGDIVDLITDIRQHMPGMNSEKFVIPNAEQMNTFKQVFSSLNNLTFLSIQSVLSQYGYTFYIYYNLPSGDTLYILKEDYPIQRGWGTFILNSKAVAHVAVECPHPLWDTNVEIVGIKVFIQAKARWYLLAGTHRYANSDNSSDPAHVTQCIFHEAHMTFAPDTALQIHGFDKSSYVNYPDVVISNGTLYPPASLYKIRDSYVAKAFTAGVFSMSTYGDLYQLGATTNTQGQWSNNNNKLFIHIEHDYPLRTNETKMNKVISALTENLSNITSVHEKIPTANNFQLEQNYPNPFNPITVISYTVKGYPASRVQLKVYDALGKEISLLVNDIKPEGVYHQYFNSRIHDKQLTAGIYFYRLTIGNYSETKKMVLLP
jgi:hypothetical protein